jgi:membrane protease YdiL (CAAX protease family)
LAQGGTKGCGLGCVGCLILICLPVIVPVLTMGIAAPYDWVAANKDIAGLIFFAVIIVGGVAWINRERLRGLVPKRK